MDECRWLRDGDNFVAWLSSERLALVRSAALDLRDSAVRLLAEPEPDIMSVSRDGVIADLVTERAHTQFDVPRDAHTIVEPWLARIITQALSRDAHTAYTLTLGCTDLILIGPDPQLRESFLRFASDMCVAYDRHAKHNATSSDQRDEFLTTSAWFKAAGASLAELCAREPTGT